MLRHVVIERLRMFERNDVKWYHSGWIVYRLFERREIETTLNKTIPGEFVVERLFLTARVGMVIGHSPHGDLTLVLW